MVGVSGETARYVFWEMPLSLVYAWEHNYYRANGVDTKRLGADDGALGGSVGSMLTALAKIDDEVTGINEGIDEIEQGMSDG